jgi:hypothetical protein
VHPLEGFVLKMNRAEHHLETIRSDVEGFNQSEFYETVAEFDYKGRLVARLKNVKQPPPELSVLIGDCVYNLRSALDQLAYGMAAAYTRPLPEAFARTVSFPIFKTGPLYRGKVRGRGGGATPKLRGMSRGTRAAIQRLQPYHGRKNPSLYLLWMLEELSNIDKHRLVHLTSAAVFGTSFQVSGTGVWRLEGLEVVPGPMKENAVVGRFYGEFAPPPAVEVKANIVPDVLFDKSTEARSVRGLPVLDVLYAIREVIVLSVLPELDKELVRLFPEGQFVVGIGELKPDHRRYDQRGYA